jgi:all-trans-8'-apo-beta-carotenal 15,15'-oxygenase
MSQSDLDQQEFLGIFWGKQGKSADLKQAQQRAWFAAFASQPQEFSYQISEIEGSIPETLLSSTLFRNGPGLFERGDTRVKHYLDGDGYLCKISFTPEGKAYFDSKFIRTEEYVQEAAQNSFLYRSAFGMQKPGGLLANILDIHLKNPSNTNIVSWGSKFLSLYEAGVPYLIDPYTLDTIGKGALSNFLSERTPIDTGVSALNSFLNGWKAMTAHPRFDPIQDRMVTWTWHTRVNLGRPNELVLDIVEYDQQWKQKAHTLHSMIGAVVNPHDFALTQSYYIFFENQFEFDFLPYLLGWEGPATCLKLKSDKPTLVHLVPRPGGPRAGTKPLVFETIPWFSIHQAFAYDTADEGVEIYSTGWPSSGLNGNFLSSWSGYAPNFDNIAPTYLWKTTIDIQRKKIEHRVAPSTESHCIDHPHINPLRETQDARYIYMSYCNNIGESSPPTGYMKLDLKTGDKQYWWNYDLSFTEELVFVPRSNAIREDDGYLLGMTYDHIHSGRSSLVIIDASEVAKGPICRLWLNHHVPHGLHGSWSPKYYGSLHQR